ncbi:Tad domain-containing protein [Lutibacter sp. B2]|nr:Tad domain-containing protein [Lutibacter sp. B2]
MKNLFLEERASTVIFFSFILIGLLGVIGIVMDGGTLFVTKAHLQKTANAVVLSAAQELLNDEEDVITVSDKILDAHNEKSSLHQLNIELGNKISIHLKKEVSLSFLRLFGFPSAPVEATSTAALGLMGRAKGAAPLGIDDSIQLEFYKEYKLKVDQTEVDAGNFGILALDGPGAKTYEQNLRDGYSGEIEIGTIIETQTGNIAGKTRIVINERINACPHPPGDISHRDCSRILLIPVYKPYDYTSNQLKKIEITGFAYFYILEPMNAQDTSVTGMFIEKTGNGFTDPNGTNTGAYSIKLTK